MKIFELKNTQHHIVAIGTQECSHSIGLSFLWNDKSQWIKAVANQLPEYTMISQIGLNAMHLIIFVHRSLMFDVKNIQSDTICTGFLNFFSNKGAIAISFSIGKQSYLFINCHLDAGQNNIYQRNQSFNRIQSNLKIKSLQTTNFALCDNFDYTFWIGDFNYRLNIEQDSLKSFQSYYHSQDFNSLLKKDQFLIERELWGFTKGFKEGIIIFPPTYKYNTDQLLNDTKSKKYRVPSWTDRILYKSKNHESLKLLNYESINTINHSDHKPIIAQFEALADMSGNIETQTTQSYCNIF